ncbi:MAG: substrate-binding domain-containing protein [Rikenellaceae bacterium]
MYPFKTYIVSILILLSVGCSNSEKFTIGVAHHKDSPWNLQLKRELDREAIYYNDIELKHSYAQNDPILQSEQINQFIEEGVDLLIITPSDDIELAPAIDRAADLEIPTILTFSQTTSQRYTASVTFDNFNIGRSAAQYVVETLNGKGNIVELCGEDRDISAIDLHSGFNFGISSYPEIKTTVINNINWDEQVSNRIIDSMLRSGCEIDLVFAHNDFMAYGAAMAAENLNLADSILFIGVGALSGPKHGLSSVSKGILDASFMQHTAGDIIMQTAHNILVGLPYESNVKLPPTIITKANAQIAQMQEAQANLLDERIKTLKIRIADHQRKDVIQRYVILTVIGIVLLILTILYVIYRSLRVKEIMNSKLQKSNEEILELSKQLEEATNSKLSFFTNISHELCTPLTLIAEPINSIIHTPDINIKQRDTLLNIAQHNASILMRLVRQILDFQRYESGMAQLNISNGDIRDVVTICNRDFAPAFSGKGLVINYCESNNFDGKTSFDNDKVEQVYYNLLSNALKYFKSSNGSNRIDISLRNGVVEGQRYAIIAVTNDNPEITEEHLQNIFERFYKIGTNANGSGIGLALSKAYIDMHGGELKAECVDGGRVCFSIHLPLNELCDADQQCDEAIKQELYIEHPVDLDLVVETPQDEERQVVLIVDDNDEIREYIAFLLQDRFSLLFAADGKIGLDVAKAQIPDLIISDIMMPVMDGVEMCSQIKKEFITSHIPILMLTACNLDEQRIEGFMSGADGYISKPFNSQLLIVRVQNLLENRARIVRGELTPEVNEDENIATHFTVEEQTFLEKFHTLITENISNSEFNVEDMYREMGLSRVQLFRKVRTLIDMSPNEILRIERLKSGDRLLRTTSKTMAEIAYEVGFSAPSYFSKCYKEHYGLPPTEVR